MILKSVGMAVAMVLGVGQVRGVVMSTFDSDAEGWQAADLVGAGDYNTVLSTFPVTWHGTGGADGGYISAADPTTNTYFFQAPAAYLGDKSTYVGGTLSFAIHTTDINYFGDRVVVLHGNNGTTLVSEVAQPNQVNVWLNYGVNLTGSQFRYTNQGGSVVSDADFLAVLGDLKALYIPAEFATPVIETTGLDSVVLTPEPGSALLAAMTGLEVMRRRRD